MIQAEWWRVGRRMCKSEIQAKVPSGGGDSRDSNLEILTGAGPNDITKRIVAQRTTPEMRIVLIYVTFSWYIHDIVSKKQVSKYYV